MRCERTDLLTTDCAHCRAEAENRLTEGVSWSALYPGVCVTCGAVFDVGVQLKWSASGEPEHVHHR